MARMRMNKTDFSAGELDPRLDGRYDLEVYAKGCSILENALPMPQGGITKVPGTHYVAEVATSEAGGEERYTRLIPMVIPGASGDIRRRHIVLEFGHETLRFYYDHEQIEDGGSPLELETPFSATPDNPEVRELKYQQIDNVLYVVHPSHEPWKLTWDGSGITDWSVGDVSFETGSVDFSDPPRAIAFKDDRLYFARDQDIFGSKVGEYEDFVVGTDDDEAFEFTIAAGYGSEILWMETHIDIVIGTSAGEYILTGGGSPITPSNVFVRRESSYGSRDIQGRLIGDSLAFVQRAGRKIREYFSPEQGAPYQGRDLTWWAAHVTGDGIVDMDFAQEPFPATWCVRDDGRIAVMVRDRIMDSLGWAELITDGDYEAVCAIRGDAQDEIWTVVRREIDGSIKRYVEYFEPLEDASLAQSVYVHSAVMFGGDESVDITDVQVDGSDHVIVTAPSHGLSVGDFFEITNVDGMTELNGNVYRAEAISGDDITLGYTDGSGEVDGSEFSAYEDNGVLQRMYETVTGLEHLEGEDVVVLADGGIHSPKTVDSGEISLDRWTNRVVTGLEYRSRARTMRLELGGRKRVVNIELRFLNTVGAKVGPDPERAEEILWMEYGDSVLGPAQRFTGDKSVTITAEVDRAGYIDVLHDYPLPFTLLALGADLSRYPEV